MTEEAKPNGTEKAMTPKQQADAFQAAIEGQMAGHLHPLIVGVISLNPHVPGQAVLLAMCGALAKIVGGMYVGEPEAVTKMRSACRVRFGEALHQTPITPLPAKPADSTPQAAPSTERPVSSTDQADPSTDPPA